MSMAAAASQNAGAAAQQASRVCRTCGTWRNMNKRELLCEAALRQIGSPIDGPQGIQINGYHTCCTPSPLALGISGRQNAVSAALLAMSVEANALRSMVSSCPCFCARDSDSARGRPPEKATASGNGAAEGNPASGWLLPPWVMTTKAALAEWIAALHPSASARLTSLSQREVFWAIISTLSEGDSSPAH